MKATSLFGGVQVFQIIIQVIRSKFVALYLGPTGMGIVGLLTSTIGLISSLTNFGLSTSAVKNIAEAYGTNNENRIATIVTVMRRLVWGTGVLGAIITFIFAPWLSKFTFGNTEYDFAFYWVSITLLINQISSGQLVLMQGLRKLHHLAKANLLGAISTLFVNIPIYYYFNINGIVPVIIISSIFTLAFSYYFSHKIKISSVKVGKMRTIAEGKNMLVMGFAISLSGIFVNMAAYFIRIYIAKQGNVNDVGLYNAGFAIISTYVGLVFTAMATDYYPRLSAVIHNDILANSTINYQAEIAILILAPIIITFIIFINYVVILLYSYQFIAVTSMVYWAAIGMLFKAASWAVAFVFLAKGEGKLFFLNELIVNVYMMLLNVFGYHLWGLSGLGISFMLGYFFYLIQVYIIAKVKYNFSYNRSFKKIFCVQFLLAFFSLVVVKVMKQPFISTIGIILIVISLVYSYNELDKRIKVMEIIKRLIMRNR
ncbi:MAG: oligosaccharide flippase family protein [Paludibacter sp.]|nr:oligosaccharide flippase family protein [Paludibacter sp.]